MPVSIDVAHVDEVRRAGRTAHRHPPHPRPRVAGVGEDPAVAGVARGVEGGETDMAVVGHVERRPTPRLGVVHHHDQLGLHAPDHRGEVAPQRQAVLDHAVDMTVEELDRLHADDGRAGVLLGLPQWSGLRRGHPVDARLTAGDEEVRHAFAHGGPARDRGGGAVLEVVGVGDDAQRARPVVREGFHRSIDAGVQNFAVIEHRAHAFLEVLERQRVVVGVERGLVPVVGELRGEVEPRRRPRTGRARSGRRRSGA